MAYNAVGALAAARADLETAIQSLPGLPEDLRRGERPKVYRLLAETLIAAARSGRRPAELAQAEKVLSEAIDFGDGLPLLYYRRAEVRSLRRDEAGARSDRDALLRLEPVDEWDWTFRGLALLDNGDPKAALDYACKLKAEKDRLAADILIVMRVYFEKPRTTVGWKGLVMDPHLDGSHDIATGLRTARTFLREVLDLGLPTALRIYRHRAKSRF